MHKYIAAFFKVLIATSIIYITGCATGQTYLDPTFVESANSLDVIILPASKSIEIQCIGGTKGQGAVIDELGGYMAAKRCKSITPMILSIQEKLDVNLINDELKSAINSSSLDVSWAGEEKFRFISAGENYNVKNQLSNSNSNIVIFIKPSVYFSPSMDFIETRLNIDFYSPKNIEIIPVYSITAVTQSQKFVVPNVDHDYHLYRQEKHIENSLLFWSENNLALLKKTIGEQIIQSTHTLHAALEDSTNKNTIDRSEIKLAVRPFPYFYSDSSQKAYKLVSFEKKDRLIARQNPDPMNTPISGMENVIYSIPKGDPVISIYNRN